MGRGWRAKQRQKDTVVIIWGDSLKFVPFLIVNTELNREMTVKDSVWVTA